MENTAFDNALGIYQGRTLPRQASAADGSFVWVAGFDAARTEKLAFGDYTEIQQTIDLTDLSLLTARLWIKQPRSLISRRDLSAGLEIVALASSVVTGVTLVGAGLDVMQIDTTPAKHYLVTGDRVTIAGVGGIIQANGSFIVTKVDNFKFTLNEVLGSGVYTSGGNIGLGERLYSPLGWTEPDVGRSVVISGAGAGQNNGTYRILGIQQQPGVSPSTLAWVERPSTALATDVSGTLTVIGKGARWKVSLLVDGGSGLKERARVVQKHSQSPFFRTDLKAYIRQLAGVRTFAARLTLIESIDTDIYPLPPAP
jgi:hypothetical protein